MQKTAREADPIQNRQDFRETIELPQDLMRSICGANDAHLAMFAQLFGVPVRSLGNQLQLESKDAALCGVFRDFIAELVSYGQQGLEIQSDLLDSVYSASCAKFQSVYYNPREFALTVGRHKVLPRNRHQHDLLRMMHTEDVIFALGPAGTGKTFLAVTYGISCLLNGACSRLLLSRPVVEAGESLGFLPGDFGQKLSPYMAPLFDVASYLVKSEQLKALEEKGMIEVAPLAYMRGRSLRSAIVVLDEAQNATSQQVKMLLTRLGKGAKAILTGDPSQSDLSSGSGFIQAAKLLKEVEGVGVQHFDSGDVVRSSLVQRIIEAYKTDTAQPEKVSQKLRQKGLSKKQKALSSIESTKASKALVL